MGKTLWKWANGLNIYDSEKRTQRACLPTPGGNIIQLLTSISVDIRIYLPEKVIFTEAGGQGEYHF